MLPPETTQEDIDTYNWTMANTPQRMAPRVEPTYSLVIAQCPNASIHPVTGEPISKQVVYDIFESRCLHSSLAFSTACR